LFDRPKPTVSCSANGRRRRNPSSENRQPISVEYLFVLEWDELLLAEVSIQSSLRSVCGLSPPSKIKLWKMWRIPPTSLPWFSAHVKL
jgi:hypothetical protein